METFLKNKEKPDVDEMIKLLKTLSKEEQKEINIFLQGMKFAKKFECEEKKVN